MPLVPVTVFFSIESLTQIFFCIPVHFPGIERKGQWPHLESIGIRVLTNLSTECNLLLNIHIVGIINVGFLFRFGVMCLGVLLVMLCWRCFVGDAVLVVLCW